MNGKIHVNSDEFNPSTPGTMDHEHYQVQGGGLYAPTSDVVSVPPFREYCGAPGEAVYYGQQSSPGYAKTIAYGEVWNQQDLVDTSPGYYYSVGSMIPQLFGAPVSSLAFDNTSSAIYAASPTSPMSQGRRWNHRASMLVTHNTLDGMLYASVAGHPEASISALQAVYQTIYGVSDINAAAQPAGRRHIPSHAYRPPYGSGTSSTLPDPTIPVGVKEKFHMGINSLLPLSDQVVSVSPSSVRIHKCGGLQVADQDLEGMICGTDHPKTNRNAMTTHIAVGGIPVGGNRRHVYCMDVWQGLRVVSSQTFNTNSNAIGLNTCGVTAMATSHSRESIVAGCSDGKIRVLDKSLREVACIRSHAGGVTTVAVSNDGNMIATTGYGSRPSSSLNSLLYAFPDPNVLIYDIRYLGRGGVAHPFAGSREGPRFLSFVPNMAGHPSNRLLVASGLAGGGLQVVTPFETLADNPMNFLSPRLDIGESISSMAVAEDDLAVGTSAGRIVKYKLAGYESRRERQPLELPPFIPSLPLLSIEPSILLSESPNARDGSSEKMKSIFTAYTLCAEPTLTIVDPQISSSSPGPLNGNVLVPSKKNVLKQLIDKGTSSKGEVSVTIPTSNLGINLLHDHSHSRSRGGKNLLQNPNKLLYSKDLISLCYGTTDANLRREQRSRKKVINSHHNDSINQQLIPQRYRLNIRPSFKSAGSFDYAKLNNTGLLPGWDYPPTLPNAFASPILFLLYFNPMIRSTILASQYNEAFLSSKAPERSLVLELAFLFHQIESLSRFALSNPPTIKEGSSLNPCLGAWVPSSFLASLVAMPEADQLQILDGSPAAFETPRRPEAFYRFLLYHLDKELSKTSESKLMDSLHGVDFISVNQFISGSGPPSHSMTRSLTVDLSYDMFLNPEDTSLSKPFFGQVLQHSLYREVRLRAWNESSRSYETIVQRKIATSLPDVLSLSCGCAGRKEEDGLMLWRTDVGEQGHWLPETLEIELEETGDVVVRELVQGKDGDVGKWETYRGNSPIPSAVSDLLKLKRCTPNRKKRRYQLDAVVTFVRSDSEEEGPDDEQSKDHHILHMRIPTSYRKRLLMNRLVELENLTKEPFANGIYVEPGKDKEDKNILERRLEILKNQIDGLGHVANEGNNWILFNGFVVSDTNIDDARAFHVAFKEPCLVVYTALGDDDEDKKKTWEKPEFSGKIPTDAMQTRSITDGNLSKHAIRNLADLPGKGDLIAFDAEFVSVQEEESTLTEKGSKVTLRETRHAVARISVFDCKTKHIVIDDHVLPQEQVVDYLTRFSGIVAKDLDPRQSPHHLISSRCAYLKLRYLMERGCIFVGHGLHQDFWLLNLVVPKRQVIDTVEIFHKDRMRYISLRFLANYVLGRDMQQDTHDSVEDAVAAYELNLRSVELKKQGKFDRFLDELYTHGRKTEWKLGVEEKKSK